MKTCGKCKQLKNFSSFRKSNKNDGYQHWCTPCFRIYDKERYRSTDKTRKNLNRKQIRYRQRTMLKEIKEKFGCIDCGNKDHRVLDFDHVRGEKHLEVSLMIGSYSDKKILEEIEKCDIRCANCHRVVTYERRERGRR